MFRAVVWTLRQRRYAGLAITMFLVALACVGAGSFETHRFQEKRHDNGVLRANAHAPATALTTALVPLTGSGPAPGAFAIRYRTVTATGRYLAGDEQYLGNQTQGGRQGFWVLTPLRTRDGTLLVVRGFVAATASGTRPAAVAAPPAGQVRVTGWLDTTSTASDQLGRLGHGEITTINPAEQAARLGRPVYLAALTLRAGQPGTAGLHTVAVPDLSNPTGGAGELQLFSYILQWYVFGLLALATPFLFSRAEVREARRRFLGIDPAATEFDEPAALAGASGGSALAVRAGATVARVGAVDAQRLARAERLADRYGRSLGDLPAGAAATVVPDRRAPDEAYGAVRRDSAAAPFRSADAYHGSYNDYLWQLALADGGLPDVFAEPSGEPDSSDEREPRIVDVDGSSADDARS